MINVLRFLESEPYPTSWYISLSVLLGLLMIPWLFLIFKYGIFRKLRVRFILNDNEELAPSYFKKNETITFPEVKDIEGKKFVGWYMDVDRTKKVTVTTMPDYNIKVYAKFEDIEPSIPEE